jgi:periplasmic divalent cation tolerance protein
MYWWEGKIERSEEVVLVAKTRTDLVNPLVERVNELHSYAVPAVLAFPITGGNPAYLNWMRQETRLPEAK